jgi:phosphatidylserine decarboxylase
MFDALFPRNERLICYLEGGEGTVAIVAVGAFNVGRITLAFDPGVATNRRNARPIELRFDPPKQVGRGEEIMAFHLGSTVVLLFERDRVRLDARLESGREIRLGEPIARPATE